MVFACGTLHAQGDMFFQDMLLNDAFKQDFESVPELPSTPGFGEEGDVTPIGDGIVLLMGLGAAYMLKNRKKNE